MITYLFSRVNPTLGEKEFSMKSRGDLYHIPWHLIVAFGLLMVTILVTGYFFYADQRKAVTQERFDDLSAIADLKVNQLARWRAERLQDAEYFRDNIEFVKSVRRFASQPASIRKRQELLRWLAPLLKNPEFCFIVLLDAQGTELVRAGVPGNTVGSISRDYIRTAHKHGSVFLSDFHYGEQSHIHLDIPVPLSLTTGSGTRAVGTLLLRIDPFQLLYPLVQSWPTSRRTAETLLVRRDGTDVLVLNELRYRKGTALVLRVPASQPGYVSTKVIQGSGGNYEGNDYRGMPVLAAARQVEGSPWFLVAKIDREELLNPLRNRSRFMLAVILLLILSVGLLVGIYWRHQSARYYRDLYREEHARRLLADRVEYLTHNANDSILLLDGDFRVIEANEKALEVYGFSREEITRLGLGDLRCETAVPDLDVRMCQVKKAGGLVFESIHCRKDGSSFPVENSIRYLEIDGRAFFQAITRDISERKKAEARIERLSHLYQALSQVNRCIFFAKDRTGLIVSICRTIVENGRFCMAWVGFVDAVTRRVVPSGSYGCEDGYLDELVISVEDLPEGHGPTGRAIRESQHVMCQNIGEDSNMEPWREKAQARGYRSSAAFPLSIADKCVGALMVYAPAPDFFDYEIVSLLDELSSNLSHALESLERDEALEMSRERLLFAMKSSSMGSWDWNLTENSFLWDDSMHVLVGLKPGDFSCSMENFVPLIHPSDRERVRQELKCVLAAGSDYESIYQVVWPNGAIRHLHSKGRVYRNEQGNPVRMAGVSWDITDKMQKSDMQQKQKELLQTMLDTIPVMICYFDTDKCLKWANSEWEKILGWTFLDLNPEEVLEKCCPDEAVRGRMLDFFGTANGTWDDFRMHTRGGSILYTTWAAVKLSDETIFAIGQDISERMKAKNEILSLNAGLEARVLERTEQLEEANRDLESFSYSVSHDLRAPLRAVKGFVNILKDEHSNELSQEGLRLTNLIVENTDRMGRLIADLLAFSRVGRYEIAREVVSMSDLVGSVIEELQSHEECGGIEFRLEPLPGAVGDEAMFRQVWMNLLANALKFTLPKGPGCIEVSSLTCDGETVYQVKDSGIGFEGEFADKLFGIFQRLHSSAEFEGSGVGLAIVQRIVTRHGGKVWAEGVKGEGATFYFSLPHVEGSG
ncbi:MAG: PAS domain S-box protein [Geobacter sp.]|nr:MAG: PAS domain S-box protein [Geobacter sp.]